jgi:ketosteroid isomerase-like protein
MLVALFNVVKVESVPLNSDFFSPAARRALVEAIIGNAGTVRRMLVIVTGLVLISSAPAHAATDEDQVRAVLNGMNGSYNSSDFKAFASHLCTGMLSAAGFEAGWYASRKSDGPTQITINSVEVTGAGDTPLAVANVLFQAANHTDTKTIDVEFLREGADWKACRYDTGRYI